MESALPTLDDMLDPDNLYNTKKEKIEEKQSNNNKTENENSKINKNEIESNIKEEIKKEENKNNESQNEKENKMNNEDNIKNIIQINQEPQKEISTKEKDNLKEESGLGKIIKELNLIVLNGNELFKKKLYDEAITKYKEGYDIINKELLEINRNITMYNHNPQIEEFNHESVKLMSNLSLSYLKKDKYKESIELDSKIISLSPKYDKAYVRLFKSYLKLNKKAEAVYFGGLLIKNFSKDIIDKYKNLIPKIEEEIKNLENEEKIEKEMQKREKKKNFLKYTLPIIILFITIVYKIFS
jgi:hypothetical protein